MSGVLNSTISIPQVVNPALVKSFDEVKNQLSQEAQYRQFSYMDYEIETTGDVMSSLSGYGPGSLTTEGQVYVTDQKVGGYNKTLVTRKYTTRAPYTEELEYFLKKRSSQGVFQVNSMLHGLVGGLVQNWDQDFAKMFYLAQGTTFITGGDGVALVSASHPSKKAGAANQSNIVTVGGTTNVELNATSLKEAMIKIDRFRDNADTLMKPARNLQLIVPRQLQDTAFVLKNSEYGPDTSNLGVGIVSPQVRQSLGKTFEVKVMHYIPDAYANYWFLVDADRMKEMVVMAKAWEPRIHDRMKDIDGVTNLLASTLFGPNPIDWRWIVGSTGAYPLP